MNQTTNINSGWSFCLGDIYDAEKAERVCLPHSVKLTPQNSSGCRNYQGKCVYRKMLFVPDDLKGKKLFLTFEGAMGVAVLNINGSEVSRHTCGYTPFVTDITDSVIFGTENEILISLDNSDNKDHPPGKPQSGLDFSYDGGLYRDASLTVCESVYVTDPLLANEVAGGGIFVRFENVTEAAADVIVKVHVKNEYDSHCKVSLTADLSYKGKSAGSFSLDSDIGGGESRYFEGTITVKEPRLWSVDSPQLYTLTYTLSYGGCDVYSSSLEIGIRTFTFTVDDGVIFNGKSHRFSGVNYHQTWPYIGNAVPDNLLLRDMMKLKEMGTENIRSHYPFSHAVTDACNRLGITLIVSNPGWQYCEPGAFVDEAVKNMRDIVRWQRNNPSVLIWEPVLNESQMSYDIQLAFHKAVHEEYPYDPCYTASDYGPTDIAYCNYDPDMLGTWHERYGLCEQKDDTPRPMWTREYGDAPDDFTNQSSIWRIKRGWGDFPMVQSVKRMVRDFNAPDDGANLYIDVYNNKRLCGYGVWPGIAHNRGYHINPCWGGHLDLFRIPKFSYYFMQSQVDRSKIGDILFIANWWAETSPSDVTVISNAEEVELYCDGQFVERRRPDSLAVAHPPFTFENVRQRFKKRARSTLVAKAYVGGNQVAEASVRSPGVARELRLEADNMGIDLIADGSDTIAVRCKLIDDSGSVVPFTSDSEPILFEISGEGVIVGDSEIGANPVCAEAGIATVLIRSTERAGDIKISARLLWGQTACTGTIKPAELIIKSISE